MVQEGVELDGEKLGQAGQAIGEFDAAHGQVVTRGLGLLQAAGGAGEMVGGAALVTGGGAASTTGIGAVPGVPAMVGGTLLFGSGADNAVTGLRQIWTGQSETTAVQRAAGGVAQALGASPETTQTVETVAGVAQGAAGGAGTAVTAASRVGKVVTAEARAVESGTAGARSTRKPTTTGRKIAKEEYDKLRSKTPSQELRDKMNDGQPVASKDNPVNDPWLSNKDRTGPLEPDHIVSMKRITEMDGFSDLSKANQLKVLNNPENFTPLSRSANGSKGAKSFEEWTSYGSGPNATLVNPELRQQMIQRSNELTPQLQRQIYDLLTSQ